MSGLEVIGTVITVIEILGTVVKVFGTPRNAPQQVERLQRILTQLEDNEDLLCSARERDRLALADMINRSRDLLEKHAPRPSTGDRVRNFLWPARAEEELKSYNDEISTELALLYSRSLHRLNAAPADVTREFAPRPPVRTSPSPSTSPDGRFLGNSSDRPRRASVACIDLPTKLTLQFANGERAVPVMKFDRLNIMERDDSFRTIEYERLESTGSAPARVTHRIPRGAIRFEDNSLADCTVVFLDAHDITIQDEKGYRINRVHAEYQFDSAEARELFLLRVRERELLGRYFARAVLWQSGRVVTQEKVIRIWKKVPDVSAGASPGPKPLGVRDRVTVSFLGREQQYFELPLGDFKRNPRQDGPGNNRVTIERLGDGFGIVFEFDPPVQRRSSSFNRMLGFSSPPRTPRTGEAEAFRDTFMEHHPATSTFIPLPSPAASIRSTSLPGECQLGKKQSWDDWLKSWALYISKFSKRPVDGTIYLTRNV
ncbi:hypothetical protein Micbo1qcDRAFT_220407 [Microdochium bolleyi]|uniref:Uncharacterized protein n=1 Tax=Microdochium bolleyi TaxID=196109 RepID=A0A136J9D3_9PEZI|nr:hypothetical protein Micbo1qcDRAFT_220407 [Microdochium bolleyi]